ncbi:MAG TPA: hypothetical protein VL354_08400, partial [Spirochaetia bacterium]|nr:hypothetical protein [Spirochaetia bacterium]
PFFKVMLDFAMVVLRADFLCVAINPRHGAAFRHLLFENLGGNRPYRGANDAPSVARYLNLRTLFQRLEEPGREPVRAVFGPPVADPAEFAGRYTLRADLDFFLERKGDAFETASAQDLHYLSRCHCRDISAPEDAMQTGAAK